MLATIFVLFLTTEPELWPITSC